MRDEMYIDILLRRYANGDIDVTSDHVASEIMGHARKFRLKPTMRNPKGELIPMLKRARALDPNQEAGEAGRATKGVSFDGAFHRLIKDSLDQVERGSTVIPSQRTLEILLTVRKELEITKDNGKDINPDKVKSEAKRTVQVAQLEMFGAPSKLSTLINAALLAASKRRICLKTQ